MHLIHCINKLNQVTVIDIDTEKDRQDNFCSLSGTDFRTDEFISKDFFTVIQEPIVEEVVEEVELTDLEKLQAQYLEVFWKEAPLRYKNDTERLNSKINETLTPVE